MLLNQGPLKFVCLRLTTHDIENLVLEGFLTVGTNALLQTMRPVFHASVIDVLSPAGCKRLPIGTSLTDRKTDILLSGHRVSEPIDKVVAVRAGLALSRHTLILALPRVDFNHYFPLQIQGFCNMGRFSFLLSWVFISHPTHLCLLIGNLPLSKILYSYPSLC